MTAIKFYSTIKQLEQKKRTVRAWRVGPNPEDVRTQDENLGWFILLEGSWEAVHVGDTKPEGFEVGQRVEVTIAIAKNSR